ncbi:hypothetical protein [Aquimarina megaterium]|uniref:hypothetical protein n=1 Tax=Aquimarina megaterium TaxID=1443666 RepID=UPI000945D5D2|nr:hypothetical protein [Aquimarina megaterium]
MGYVRVDIKKASGGGAPQSKSQEVVVIDVADTAYWPNRDDKGVRMVGDIVMKPGKYATIIEATASTISLPITSEGEEDAVSFTSLPEFSHPGSSLEFDEFVTWATNKNLILGFRIGACDGDQPYYRFYGTPCTPLSLMIEGVNNNESTTNLVKFQQFQKSRTVPGRYYGTVTFATVNTVVADETTIDVTAGSGRYQLQDNTVATAIADITNATDGISYTLLGSGGTNPATIASSNANFLLAGAVDWQGLAGTSITFEAIEQAGGDFVFVERSRA